MNYFELGPSEPFYVVYERATGELPVDRGNTYTGKHHKHLMEQESNADRSDHKVIDQLDA